MTEKIILVNSSTDLKANKTLTIVVPLPDSVMGLPRSQRNSTASALLTQNNEPLGTIDKNYLSAHLDSLFEGKKGASIIQAGPTIQVINMIGPNSRVYIGSRDRSVNVTEITPEEVFSELRKIITEHVKAENQRTQLLLKVKELEESREKSSYSSKYTEFVNLAANHMTLFAPLIPALTKWLIT